MAVSATAEEPSWAEGRWRQNDRGVDETIVAAGWPPLD
jgi:hypothetical protein